MGMGAPAGPIQPTTPAPGGKGQPGPGVQQPNRPGPMPAQGKGQPGKPMQPQGPYGQQPQDMNKNKNFGQHQGPYGQPQMPVGFPPAQVQQPFNYAAIAQANPNINPAEITDLQGYGGEAYAQQLAKLQGMGVTNLPPTNPFAQPQAQVQQAYPAYPGQPQVQKMDPATMAKVQQLQQVLGQTGRPGAPPGMSPQMDPATLAKLQQIQMMQQGGNPSLTSGPGAPMPNQNVGLQPSQLQGLGGLNNMSTNPNLYHS